MLINKENALYFFAVFTDRQYFHGSFSGAVWDICYSSIIDQIVRRGIWVLSFVASAALRARFRSLRLLKTHRKTPSKQHRLFSGAKESDIQMRLDISLDYLQRIKENLREGGAYDTIRFPISTIAAAALCFALGACEVAMGIILRIFGG